MKISLVQTHIHWENPEANYAHLETLLNTHTEASNLIVLPEMFTTGFTMNPKTQAEDANTSQTLNWLKKQAVQKKAVITGSVALRETNRYYNRLFWVQPNGNYFTYNKRHLFRMGNEHQHYTAGSQRLITTLNNWTICPQICYDLRFPVWSRNQFKSTATGAQPEYDVLLYVANWPEVRRYPWRQLLIARAIENQCYVVGLNRVGEDGNGIAHCGDSLIINPRGEIILEVPLNTTGIYSTTLSKTYLEEFRQIFPVGLDADAFSLEV